MAICQTRHGIFLDLEAKPQVLGRAQLEHAECPIVDD